MRWFGANKSNATEKSPGGKLNIPTIVARNIKSVADLDGPHFVFLLTFNDGEQVVLKAEMSVQSGDLATTHNIGVRIMGFVSPVKAVTLSEMEVMQVSQIDTGISQAFFSAELAIRANKAYWVKAVFQKDLVSLKNWDSMDDVILSSTGGAPTRVVNPEKKAKAVAVMAVLDQELAGNSKAWKSLGQIVAVDMLLGNLDRINVHTGGFDNLPNVQFRWSGKKIVSAVGLDTFDPAHLSSSNLFDSDLAEWKTFCGDYLKDMSKARAQFLEVIDSGADEMRRMFGQCSWGPKEAKYLFEGYESGASKLKSKMKSEAKTLMMSKNAPKGLMMRLTWLNWL